MILNELCPERFVSANSGLLLCRSISHFRSTGTHDRLSRSQERVKGMLLLPARPRNTVDDCNDISVARMFESMS